MRLQDQMRVHTPKKWANPRQKVGIAGIHTQIISWFSELKQHQSAQNGSIMWRSWIAEAKSCIKLAESQNGRGRRPKSGVVFRGRQVFGAMASSTVREDMG
jgi:hypothetical protein